MVQVALPLPDFRFAQSGLQAATFRL